MDKGEKTQFNKLSQWDAFTTGHDEDDGRVLVMVCKRVDRVDVDAMIFDEKCGELRGVVLTGTYPVTYLGNAVDMFFSRKERIKKLEGDVFLLKKEIERLTKEGA